MKVAYICSNYGSSKDGIGDYSKNIVTKLKQKSNMEVQVFSSNIIDYNAFHRLVSLKMSKQFFKVIKKIKIEKYDILNIEYPFTEWNPFIVVSYSKLALLCKKIKIKLVLSVHEYSRVNVFRKKVIEYMVRRADKVLVTDEITKKSLSSFNKNIYIRGIPSNIQPENEINCQEKDLKQYLFFGLINKSKAFEEMIMGWKKFHKINKDCKLTIISSTEISDKDFYKYNIYYKKNILSNEISELMNKASFCVLPIKPNVNYNNATLKTSSLFQCIPIGIFDKELYKNKPFWVDMNRYDEESFYNAFIRTTSIDDLKSMQANACIFSEKFKIDKIVDDIYSIFLE